MALEPGFAFEVLRHDSDVEVPSAFGGAGVPGVQVTLVLDPEFERPKAILERLADTVFTPGRHGNTRLKGLTLTFA